ncbi:hypothetical protein acdb102_45560 [Acidothermaceae bacterium B102]|nr:hypothetical protein acdb102_45560 [Acidothermaceae bacterium B102]
MPRPASGPLPPGWPDEVRPPATPEWERSAVAWLFDLCPPDYRAHDVLRRHPVILARLAREHCQVGVEAARRGRATVRADLAGAVPPEAIEATVGAYEREGARLVRAVAAVALVEAALRGERWVPRL